MFPKIQFSTLFLYRFNYEFFVVTSLLISRAGQQSLAISRFHIPKEIRNWLKLHFNWIQFLHIQMILFSSILLVLWICLRSLSLTANNHKFISFSFLHFSFLPSIWPRKKSEFNVSPPTKKKPQQQNSKHNFNLISYLELPEIFHQIKFHSFSFRWIVLWRGEACTYAMKWIAIVLVSCSLAPYATWTLEYHFLHSIPLSLSLIF